MAVIGRQSIAKMEANDSSWRSRLLVFALLLSTLLSLASTAFGAPTEEPRSLEHKVKAAFLYKFLAFLEWPASAFAQPDSPIVIGVLGADALADELTEAVRGRQVNGRSVLVRRIEEGEDPFANHMLFVGLSGRNRIAQLSKEASARSVLTVTEVPGGLDLGSVINFLIVDGRVRFEIGIPAAEEIGVKVSSRLLAVAYRVQGIRKS
jgi:hypothetical protein